RPRERGEGGGTGVPKSRNNPPAGRKPMKTVGSVTRLVAATAVLLAAPAAAQERKVEFKQVAHDLHFLYDFGSSNAVVLATGEGVLVIDTRQHPRDGQ